MKQVLKSILNILPLIVIMTFLFTHERGEEILIKKRKPHHVAGLVLARGGSKGIPLKNMAKLNNETLLARTLLTMHKFNRFNSIWVSTDNEKIFKEAKKYKAKVHWRKKYTATDTATSVSAVNEFLESHRDIDTIALIQCTSPFLKVEYLMEAFEAIMNGDAESVFTVTRQFKLRWRINSEGILEADNFNPRFRPRRQDWNGELVENGMLFFTSREMVKEYNILQGGRLKAIEVPASESLEIDTENDLVMAQLLLNREEYTNK